MNEVHTSTDYHYSDAECGHAHSYLLPRIEQIIEDLEVDYGDRIFDLGCGNGSVAAWLNRKGFEVTGVDPSEEGVQEATKSHPELDIHVGSAYDDLESQYGQYPLVVSLEVVEHVYSPRKYASTLFDLVEDGGTAIVSTPYHSYLKNLVLVLLGKIGTSYYSPLWRHGHIKIWSPDTLSTLLKEQGFSDITFHRVGRVPPLAKSMIAVAHKDTRNV
jgi:2-polyprenyl-6-hydroxyphenyl methylase/3-demethylubiquinone-9 3-methyltransferase